MWARQGPSGVLLMMQAEPVGNGMTKVRARLVERARAFGRPVLLVHGDEHRYEEEPAYAGVPNLRRSKTVGDTAASWLRLTVDPRSPSVFSWVPQVV